MYLFFHTFFKIRNSWTVYSHRRNVHAVIVTFCVGQHYINCHFHITYVPEAETAVGTLPILRRVRLWTRCKTGTAGPLQFLSEYRWSSGRGREMKLTNRVCLVPGLRMCGAPSPQIYIPSWPSQGQLYLSRLCNKGKGKAIPLQAWTGPEGSRRLRLPDFKTVGTWRW